jgi:hypothetical protein
MGSTALIYQLSGTMTNAGEANYCAEFFTRVNDLARKYPGRMDGSPFGGLIEISNELAAFLGTKYVMPLQWVVDTVEEFPNTLRFQLTVTEFDPTQRGRELLHELTEDLNKANKNGLNQQLHSDFDTLQIKYLKASELNRRLRATDAYPDLGLPTHKQIAEWVEDIRTDRVWNWASNRPFLKYEYLDPLNGGTGWNWSASPLPAGSQAATLTVQQLLALTPPEAHDRWAEPDFYCAPCHTWGQALVEQVVGAGLELDYEFFDTNGDSVKQRAQQTLADSVKTSLQSKNGAFTTAEKLAAQARQGWNSAPLKPKGTVPAPVDLALRGQLNSSETFLPFGQPLQYSNTGLVPKNGAAGNPNNFIGNVPKSQVRSVAQRFQEYKNAIVQTAQAMGLDPALLAAVLAQESRLNPDAISPTGARGNRPVHAGDLERRRPAAAGSERQRGDHRSRGGDRDERRVPT